MKYTIASIATLLATSLANPVPATADSPPAFKINNVISGGSGCPQGTIDIDYSNSAIMPIYFPKDFTASVGPNVPIDQQRKNCQISIDLTYSPGWSYSVYSADYTGYADLDAGVSAQVRALYYFAGYTQQCRTGMTINGPFTGKYTKHDDVAVSVWSPCGGEGMLNVNADVVLSPTGTSATGTVVAIKESARFTHQLYIKWKQC